ncbi:GNAT family N-acetyltransferase [Lentibacter sp. XHP0401]|uniref:GNAT family N-acetyltransferase n=1 Tax=Lentibacter sp. XHP0401 TaxID=2984334 RepID=UPI0021E97ADC|nr:GNAT family N-acetyltransferase [Lentibacter sp. XHP0401]MCV2892648.1 GNAT family N-acetyltransferase [Lentibacter sp. XHP0401]
MHLRHASPADARVLAELLNTIIAEGGTTALKAPLTKAEMKGWIGSNPAQSAFLMAEDDTGQALGWQSVGPGKDLPREACNIATFTLRGKSQLGIGSALFKETVKSAKTLGYVWINATILTQNEGGIIYYQSRGFEPYQHTPERVLMRFNLR